jgi:hypothetical protein
LFSSLDLRRDENLILHFSPGLIFRITTKKNLKKKNISRGLGCFFIREQLVSSLNDFTIGDINHDPIDKAGSWRWRDRGEQTNQSI